jgi:hypothetical protein
MQFLRAFMNGAPRHHYSQHYTELGGVLGPKKRLKRKRVESVGDATAKRAKRVTDKWDKWPLNFEHTKRWFKDNVPVSTYRMKRNETLATLIHRARVLKVFPGEPKEPEPKPEPKPEPQPKPSEEKSEPVDIQAKHKAEIAEIQAKHKGLQDEKEARINELLKLEGRYKSDFGDEREAREATEAQLERAHSVAEQLRTELDEEQQARLDTEQQTERAHKTGGVAKARHKAKLEALQQQISDIQKASTTSAEGHATQLKATREEAHQKIAELEATGASQFEEQAGIYTAQMQAAQQKIADVEALGAQRIQEQAGAYTNPNGDCSATDATTAIQ